MYWWSIEKLAQNLAKNTYSRSDTLLFSMLNLLLSFCQSIIYTSLLFSFLIVEYHFKDWLPGQHAMIDSYNKLAWVVSFINLGIAATAISFCYYRHRTSNGKNFWQRFCALNSSIGFHVLLYSAALLFIALSLLYVMVILRIELFKGSIINTESAMKFVERLFTNPFTEKASTAPLGVKKSAWGSLLSLPITILSLPFLPGKITAFLIELREFILQFYPFIAFMPTLLLLIQYFMVQRWFKFLGKNSKQ
jgi:hypothetical protein